MALVSKGSLTLAVMAILLTGMLAGRAEALSPFLKRVLRAEREGRGIVGEVGRAGRRALLGQEGTGDSCSADQNKCMTEEPYKSFSQPSCCGGVCVDVEVSNQHCGSCGSTCAWGLTCSKGKCCDLQTDPKNCGTVGHECGDGDKCELGMCGYAN